MLSNRLPYARMEALARNDPNTVAARVARAGLWCMGGWRLVGDAPTVPRAVCLAVPHTTNSDGLLLVLLTKSVGMSISWMVKDSWTKGIIGPIVRAVGGIGIDRSAPSGMVGQMVEELRRRTHLHLVIPPEGTRSRTEHWKSGFYHIALGADVPVVPAYIDYRNKTGRFGDPIAMTGDVRADMDRIRGVYTEAREMAAVPENFGPIRLREEDEV